MKKLLLIAAILFANLMNSQASEEVLNANFMKLLEAGPSLFLITFEDLNTHQTKEIAILDRDLTDAYQLEHQITYGTGMMLTEEMCFKTMQLMKKNGSRHFKFSNPKSLEILNRNYVSDAELKKFSKKVNIDAMIKNFKTGKDTSIDFDNQPYTSVNYYGYLLSKAGFQINYFLFNCFGGNSLYCSNCPEKPNKF